MDIEPASGGNGLDDEPEALDVRDVESRQFVANGRLHGPQGGRNEIEEPRELSLFRERHIRY